MTSPKTLRAAFVAALRDVPTLVSLLDGPSDITEYVEHENGDLYATIQGLEPPKVLVVFQGIEASRTWGQLFSLILRPSRTVSPEDVFAALVEGTVTSSGLPMLDHVIHSNYLPMASMVPRLVRQMIPVTESSAFTYWEIQTGFKSRWNS